MSNLVIRQAEDIDLERVLEIYREAEIGTEQFLPEEAQEQLGVLRKYPSYRVFVAERDGELVGTYELLIIDNLAKRGRKSAIVEDVAVANAHKGCGIGRQMIQHAMNLAKEARCYKLVLSSNLKREDAHSFYEKLGFEKHGYSFRVDIG